VYIHEKIYSSGIHRLDAARRTKKSYAMWLFIVLFLTVRRRSCAAREERPQLTHASLHSSSLGWWRSPFPPSAAFSA
jgi:hypothetical protein